MSYVSGFSIVAPPVADVDRINNIAGNWTWAEGDPTKILIHLFVNNITDVCVFTKANPIHSEGIQRKIQEEMEIDGQRHGTIFYQADKVGEYILCAYEDVTMPEGYSQHRHTAGEIANRWMQTIESGVCCKLECF
ncbi:hypothetical protein VNI00_016141 [Paramarasmius palmivorus]|uniref:Uncharacterized protein n=1 Tax=Paramarasmius palmivorus TaxID=297713 RepID=A0AAW0BF08_9AGAR